MTTPEEITEQASSLRKLAKLMELEGACLQRLDNPHAFSRGAQLKNAADMTREWANELEKEMPTK